MELIDKLLAEIGEDKCDNFSTTSFKFKKDLWEFFQGFDDKIAVEFGTHKGQTTKILSHLFKKVYTVNRNDNETAINFNKLMKILPQGFIQSLVKSNQPILLANSP